MGRQSMEYDALPVAELVEEKRHFWNLSRALTLALSMSLLVAGVMFASQQCSHKTRAAGDVQDPFRPPVEHETSDESFKQFTSTDYDFAGPYESQSTEMNGFVMMNPGQDQEVMPHHHDHHHHHPPSSKHHSHGDPEADQGPLPRPINGQTKSRGKVKGQREKPHPHLNDPTDNKGGESEKHHPHSPGKKSPKKSSKKNKHSPPGKKSSLSESDSSDSWSDSLDD